MLQCVNFMGHVPGRHDHRVPFVDGLGKRRIQEIKRALQICGIARIGVQIAGHHLQFGQQQVRLALRPIAFFHGGAQGALDNLDPGFQFFPSVFGFQQRGLLI